MSPIGSSRFDQSKVSFEELSDEQSQGSPEFSSEESLGELSEELSQESSGPPLEEPSKKPRNLPKLLDVQKLSIQLLDIERTRQYVKNATESDKKKSCSLKELIGLIVEIYNSKEQAQKKNHAANNGLISFPSDTAKKHGFKRCVYTRSSKFKTRLARSAEASSHSGAIIPKSSNTIFLLFYYRSKPRNEIFAVTNGHAWKVVRPCISYQFTKRVAKRILDPNQVTEIVRRCLVGSNLEEKLTNPSGHELFKTTTLYYLVESFTAAIKIGSSLHCLFDELNQTRPKSIKISTGLLRIEKEIPLECYPTILNQLSYYDKEKKTYAQPPPDSQKKLEVLDPRFEFLDFLQEVRGLTPTLNNELVLQVVSDAQRTSYQVHLCYKHLQDFLNGKEFKIQLEKGKHFQPLSNHPPTLETIVKYLSKLTHLRVSSDQLLKNTLENGFLRFTTADGEQVEVDLIKCLEGELRYNNQSYFKIKGMWYLLRADYHMLLQQDFKQILRSLLLGSQTLLPLQWDEDTNSQASGRGRTQKRKPEEIYNRRYLYTDINGGKFFGSEEGYIVLDQVLPFNIEPCDIVRYTDTTTYLIHVKEHFGQKTRDVCSQILNAAKEFRSQSILQADDFLSELWKTAISPGRPNEFRTALKMQLEHLGKENFLQIFSRKLVFVYAYVPSGKANLAKESSLPTYISAKHLESISEAASPEDLFEGLQFSEYLDKEGRFTTKFYSTTQKRFKDEFSLSDDTKELSIEVKGSIYKHLKQLSTTSRSTLAKLEVLQLAKEMRDLGFDLKICEIQRSGHTKKHSRDESSSSSDDSTKFPRNRTTEYGLTHRSFPSCSPSSSSSQLPPEEILTQSNPLKDRKNTKYQYQAADILMIQANLLKGYSDFVHLLKPLDMDPNEVMINDICIKIREKPVLGTYNSDGNHWVAFHLSKDDKITCLYKDSIGGNPIPSKFMRFIKKIAEQEQMELEVKRNVNQEQVCDVTSCGIFALRNMKILMEQMLEDRISETNKFKQNFRKFSSFCRLGQIAELRNKEFPSCYVKEVHSCLKEEQHHARCRAEIRFRHQEELKRLEAVLREDSSYAIKVLGNDEDLDRFSESNTIAIELFIDKLDLEQQTYSYCYCFRPTSDIPVDSLRDDLIRLLNLPNEKLKVEDDLIKVDSSSVDTPKEQKLAEFSEPAADIDENDLFERLNLDSEEQREFVRGVITAMKATH